MRTSTPTRFALTLAALYSSTRSADVTLYLPAQTTTESLGFISQTGDLTIKPVSTATNGQTAYEVQFNATGAALIRPGTTSTIEIGTSMTTYTFLADATTYNVAHTVGVGPDGNDILISERECIKHDDGSFVCEARGEWRVNIDSTSTSTDTGYVTYTALATPWYTIKDSGATSLRFTSGGTAMVIGVLTSFGFATGLLLVL